MEYFSNQDASKIIDNCRRKKDVRRRNESFGEILLKSPWWVSAVLGVFAFAGLR